MAADDLRAVRHRALSADDERLDDPEVTVDLRGVALTELQRVARLLNELLGMARAAPGRPSLVLQAARERLSADVGRAHSTSGRSRGRSAISAVR